MGQESYVEIERKYDVDAEALVPSLVGTGAVAAELVPETIELMAVYFDTADLGLARHAIALRRREGGGDEGWHIKLPGDEGRTELHWPLGAAGEVPESIRVAVRDQIGDAELLPLARVANTRITTALLDEHGLALAELCDDHVRSDNLRDGASRSWREWEVELLQGAPDTRDRRTALLDSIEARILAAGAHPSASSSKLARALGLDDLH